MSAKREKKQRDLKVQEVEADWDIAEYLKDDPLFQEIAQELLHPKELGKVEKLQSEIGNLFETLCNPSSEPDENAKYEERWVRFLHLNVALATREFIANGIPKEKVSRLIVYGWAVFDEQSAVVRFRFGPPLDGGEAAQVILVFHNAAWRPPTLVEAAAWRHPSIRTAAGENGGIDWKASVMERLAWAKSLPDQGTSSQRLREISDAITDMLYVPNNPDPVEEGWIASAIQSARFWAILAHAVNFGLHQNARSLFLDGKLLRTSQRSALNDKIEKLSWFLIIDEVIREDFTKTGRVATPSKLRKLFKSSVIPGGDEVVLEFVDPRFKQHGEITWGAFTKYAKQAGKSWSDHQTQ
jgi:hypothetical protein